MQLPPICLVSVVQMFQILNLYNDCQMQSHRDVSHVSPNVHVDAQLTHF